MQTQTPDPRNEWQSKSVEDFLRSRHDFLVTATPGAGKTRMAFMAARELLDCGEVERIIVVVPSENLKHQWAEVGLGFHVDVTANYRNSDGQLTAARHGAVTTYQQVINAQDLWRKHTSDRRTLVIFDEVHHAGDEKTWGVAIKHAFEPAVRRLLLSGTPFRTDGQPIPFVSYDGNGLSVSHGGINYSQAVERNIVRPVTFEVLDGDAQWIDLGNLVSVRMSETDDDEGQMRAWSVMRSPDQQWIPSVFWRANEELTRQRDQLPNAGGLIYASTIQDAERYAQIMSDVCGERVGVVYSDMAGNPNIEIKRFAHGNQRWMVAVKMVSEGVDIPRAVVGVYASDITTELWFRQVVGRLVRIIGSSDEVVATMFIPNITKLCEIANRIEQEAQVALREASDESRIETPKGELRLSLIEPLHASEAEVSEVIRRGEGFSKDEIAHAEELRLAYGFRNHHASDIAKMLREHDERRQPAEKATTLMSVPASAAVPVDGDAKRRALRKQQQRLVQKVHQATGRDHSSINTELINQFGCKVTEADTANLRKRIAYLEDMLKWR